MSTTPINDGGPAFPQPLAFNDGQAHVAGEYFADCNGMTLRDWFAGKALQGELASDAEYSVEWRNDADEVRLLGYGSTPASDGTNWRRVAGHTERLARACFAYADAMIAARNEVPK